MGYHIDARDKTIRGCQHKEAYQNACACDGFRLWFARKWPEGYVYQVKTEGRSNTWGSDYTVLTMIPIEYTLRRITRIVLVAMLLMAFGAGCVAGACVAWMRG